MLAEGNQQTPLKTADQAGAVLKMKAERKW